MKGYISPEMERFVFAIATEDICTSAVKVDEVGKPSGSDEVYDDDIVPIQ